ncbi:MAG: DapH/DapD/GlmU-related protein [Desulfococcaceae bacterium]
MMKTQITNDMLKDRIEYFERFWPMFFWLKWFYPKAKGVPLIYQLYFFLPQKVFRINGGVPWPVHFTSRILYHKNVSLGNRSALGMTGGCYIQARNGISVGHNVRMGPGVGLISANHSMEDYDIHVPCSPIVIGDNVWLGMNTVVMPGITIGSNVIIGASSVVTHDVPSNVIAGGNPCRVIREKTPYTGKDYSNVSSTSFLSFITDC